MGGGDEQLFWICNSLLDFMNRIEYMLTCPACNLRLEEPMLLTCDHIVCRICFATRKSLACPKCNVTSLSKDVRRAIFMDEMVKISTELRVIEELNRRNHAEDLKRTTRLSRMLECAEEMKQRINERWQAEFAQMKKEREDSIKRQLAMRRMERDRMRKLIFFVTSEEQRVTRLHQEEEEEEARKGEEEERKKKEEAERRARLDPIVEKQRKREREVEEKECLRCEALLRPSVDRVQRTARPPAASTWEEMKKKEEAERKAKLDWIVEKQRKREREVQEKECLRCEALLRLGLSNVENGHETGVFR